MPVFSARMHCPSKISADNVQIERNASNMGRAAAALGNPPSPMLGAIARPARGDASQEGQHAGHSIAGLRTFSRGSHSLQGPLAAPTLCHALYRTRARIPSGVYERARHFSAANSNAASDWHKNSNSACRLIIYTFDFCARVGKTRLLKKNENCTQNKKPPTRR